MKLIIFDLDNTLYPEETYVQSGFRAVARYLSEKYNQNLDELYLKMMDIFDEDGRGNVFDLLVNDLNFNENVSTLVYIYRYHIPDITFYSESVPLLKKLRNNYKLALITDGRSFVQKRKVDALNIEDYFDIVVYTDVLGENYWKPSVEPYKLVLSALGCDAKDAYYIGDDPYKDFKAPKILGMKSIQVKMEDEMDYWKKRGYERFDADFQVDNLKDILGVLDED